MNPTIKEFDKYLDNRVCWTRRDDSFQAQAKRLGVIGHHPSHAPSA